MSYKKVVFASEKKIIEKGDSGEPFSNLNEAEIYLRNLQNNYDYYVERFENSQYLDPDDINIINFIIGAVLFGLGLVVTASVAAISIFVLGSGPELAISIAKIAAGIFAVNLISNPLIKKGINHKAKKQLNQLITNLQTRCAEVEKSNNETIEEMGKILETAQEKETSIDKFIANIRDDMIEIMELKYPNYVQDLAVLYNLALKYLEVKKKHKLATPADIFASNPDFYKCLLEIEKRMEDNRTTLSDRLNREAIEETLSHFAGTIPATIEPAPEENNISLQTAPFRARTK